MTCDRDFLHIFSVWTVPVCLLGIRGELAIGAHLRATDLYTVGSFDPDHDAVMRIGGEATLRGTAVSNPIPFSSESANFRSLSPSDLMR